MNGHTNPTRQRGITFGLERCLHSPPDSLRGAQLGLLMNQASVDGSFRYACDLIAETFPGQLAAIFSPQHGLWGEEQANMIESPDSRYAPLGLPIYSLYSQTRRPTAEMLRGLDVLLVDLQDVGTRVYTFIWTVRECLIACAAAGVRVVILDRPNPLGGEIVEGPLLEAGYESFVGGASVLLRHGLTIGELALLINEEQRLGAELEVVPMDEHTNPTRQQGMPQRGMPDPSLARRVSVDAWQREMLWSDTHRAWVAPSPNMPRAETALLYPGQVLLEGTNLSEGRGTTLPFELVGAPFIDPHRLMDEIQIVPMPGIALRPVRFVPTFDKWRGQRCGGVALHITEPKAVRSVDLTIHLLAAIRRLYPRDFAWLPPPYEYEREKMPIDILFGSPRLREWLAAGPSPSEHAAVEGLVGLDQAAWQARVRPHLLYA